MAQILNGKELSKKILSDLRKRLLNRKIKPVLSIILVGTNQESVLYTDIKKKKGIEIGIDVNIYSYPEDISQDKLISSINELNKSSDGLIVQLPLPIHLDQKKVLNAIDPSKDVDGLTAFNNGKLVIGDEKLVPATPKGIIRLLEEYKIGVKGKNVVIVNHSNILGKPLAAMMLNRNATVTICHKFTRDLSGFTEKADLLITGVGQPKLITKDMIKKGAVIIDVGITKKGKNVFGDVDFNEVEKKASFITPVPGGVGPMTVAMLLENLVEISSDGDE